MKKIVPLLAIVLAGCHRDTDVVPDTVMAPDEVEITTQGRNSDCGVAQVVASDPAQVQRVIGPAAYAPTYLAYQLDTALWVRKNRVLYVRIRKPQPKEAVMCKAFGPGYAAFVVLSARIKPGSE